MDDRVMIDARQKDLVLDTGEHCLPAFSNLA
jgi:hypothetical protein